MDSQLKTYLITFHQGVERNLPNGHEEKRRIKRQEEKRRFKSHWSNKIISLHRKQALSKRGLSRDNGSIKSGSGLEKQLVI